MQGYEISFFSLGNAQPETFSFGAARDFQVVRERLGLA
jgi:hypothetical protein